MNNRITELWEQSAQRNDIMNQARYEKFAELIVRECVGICEEHPTWTGRMIGEEIKQHFGVEE